jgi:glutathione peroxidase-family protein
MNKKNLIILASVLTLGFAGYGFGRKLVDKTIDSENNLVVASIEVDGYQVGDEATDFNLKNINGKMFSLRNYENAKGFIIVFTSNHCPFSKAYEERLVVLDAKYASKGYPVIALNPNDPEAYEEDTFENMKLRAREKGFTFPYLVDTKGIGQKYGASRTPHVFVVKKEGGKNIVKYIGAVDDSAQDAAAVNKKYVEDAVNNLLADKPVITQTTKAIGCAIKWRSNS